MVDLPVAFAFSAGIVAAFNPCGFALLPVYLTRFLGAVPDRKPGPIQGLKVAAAVSAGFMVVFGLVGLVFSRVSLALADYFPWLTVIVGLILVPAGIAMIRGYHPNFSLPRLQKGASGLGIGSMVAFGASYGTVSLSCTLPIFLTAVSATFIETSVAGGLAVFAAYGLGMAVVLAALTVAVALAREGLLRRLKSVMPHVNRLSGGLMVIAGLYITFYGYYSIRVNRGDQVSGGPVDVITQASARIANWVNDVQATRLGLALLGFVILSLAWTWPARRRAPASVTDPAQTTPAEAERVNSGT
ncbi:MAG: cytochrome c biogenesis CcdA family protein [Actinomycetota bacterium]